MDKRFYRGILSLIALIIYLGLVNHNPAPAVIIIALFLLFVMFAIRINTKKDEVPSFFYDYGNESTQRTAALNQAKIFLAPYKDIWRDLRLSNKYCSLILEHDGVTIKCIEKVKPYRKLRIIESRVHSVNELWNLFCIYFSYNKSYDGVLEDCHRYQVSTIESYGIESENTQNSDNKMSENSKGSHSQNKNMNIEKLDINNCSEIELTELPGVSIVLAKKAIKRREEIGGFKSVEDFLKFIKLKPHMETQLRSRIKAGKMKGSIYQKRYSERSVDF